MKSLQSLLIEDEAGFQVREETCHWFNLVIAFVFREWRDSTTVKRYICMCHLQITMHMSYYDRFVMKKVNKEFEELMFTRTEGRIIEQLTVKYISVVYYYRNEGGEGTSHLKVTSLLHAIGS